MVEIWMEIGVPVLAKVMAPVEAIRSLAEPETFQR